MRLIRLISPLVLVGLLGALLSHAQMMTIVNGASFDPAGPMAPGSFASMFGENLCSETVAGDWIAPGQLPTELGGCSVTVNGSFAMMHYTSPGQVNFIVPEGLGPGMAQVSMHNGSNVIHGTMQVGKAGPGVFSMNGMGMGQGAMLHGTMWQRGPFSVNTNGQPTPVSIFVTGLDLSVTPVVEIGGVPAEVTWFGDAPGFVGLQQINVVLMENMAGVGLAPVTVTSDGVTSNVTFMNVLPTTGMMQGMPGWGSGMMVGENMRREREMSYLAFNASNNTALVTDEEDDALRVISMDSFETVRTITLPKDSKAYSVAVNGDGTLAAVALSHNGSVALVNLQQPDDITIVGTGVYPSHLAFAGTNLLVTNAGSSTLSVIDTTSGGVSHAVEVGFGPTGVAADQTRAVVANMQAGSLSVVDIADFSVTNIDLPLGTRPHEVAIAGALNKTVVTTPMSNGFLILDLSTNQFTQIETSIWNAMGPGAVVTHNSRAYIANQMTASVTVVDLQTNTVLSTFPVDPGPRALSIDPARNRLLVLSHGTGSLSAVDLTSFAIVGRANATDGEQTGEWVLPRITSITPDSARRGTSFDMTITGVDLHDVERIEFHIVGPGAGMGPGGGMGSGGGMGPGSGIPGGMMTGDENIRTSGLQVSADGAKITVNVEILANAVPGTRRTGLETDRGEVIGGPTFNNWFTVTE